MKYANQVSGTVSADDVQLNFRESRTKQELILPNIQGTDIPTEVTTVETIVCPIPVAVRLYEMLGQLLHQYLPKKSGGGGN